MLNDNFFSWKRFSAYFRKLWVERWRTNLLRFGILFGLMLLISMWLSMMTYPGSREYLSKDNFTDPVHIPVGLCHGNRYAARCTQQKRTHQCTYFPRYSF